MSVSTKTGLMPSQRKKPLIQGNAKTNPLKLSLSTVTRRADFSLRPFGGLYNPYAKGCSVLCNHPAPSAVRSIIRSVKESWSSEGKSYWQDCFSHQQKVKNESGIHDDLSGGHIPEDLFRRYTDTDSRPMTPSPTTASVRTRTSAGSFLNARRCVTPEPGKDAMIKRKKIILDLRRSHSQETLYWRAPSEVSQAAARVTSPTTSRKTSSPAKAVKTDDHSIAKVMSEGEFADIHPVPVCINDRDAEDNGIMQRRGKRRKRSKTQLPTATFHISQDPETQVATLGPDSLNASNRPSLVPNATEKLLTSTCYTDVKPTQLKNSFLTEEAFRVLKTELDIDVIENTFERYLNKAMKEAIKYLPRNKPKIYNLDSDTDSMPSILQHSQIPRKFSKSASRFEVPIDLFSLKNTSVFEYLSRYVWVSRQRKQLYKRVFLKYLKEDPTNEEIVQESTENEGENVVILKERTILSKKFPRALKEVLGFYGTDQNVAGILKHVNLADDQELNFRCWCGIVAYGERFALSNPTATDSCDELEKADFDTLEQRIDDMELSEELKGVFSVIRKGHCLHVSNLSNIFGVSVETQRDKEAPSLRYVSPKQKAPSNTTSTAIKDHPSNSGGNDWKVQIAKVVTAYKTLNQENISQGKIGLAILINNNDDRLRLILYRSKNNVLSTLTFKDDTKIYRNNLYLQFHDDLQLFWSVLFENGDLDQVLDLLGDKIKTQLPQPAVINEQSEVKNTASTENDKSDTLETPAKDVSSDENLKETKANLLKRMAKMGQPLPKLHQAQATTTDFSDSSDNEAKMKLVAQKPIVSNRKPKSQNLVPMVANNLQMIPASGYANFIANPANLAVADSQYMNILLAENRTVNSELRMNLSKLESKIEKVLDKIDVFSGKNGDGEKCANKDDEIFALEEKVLELKKKNRELRLHIEELEAKPKKLSIENTSEDCYSEIASLLARCDIDINTESEPNEIYKRLIQRLDSDITTMSESLESATASSEALKLEVENLSLKLQETELRLNDTKANYTKEVETLNSKLKDAENKTFELANSLKDQSHGTEQTVKEIMNNLYQKLAEQFQNKETFTAVEVTRICAHAIKRETNSLIKKN